MTRSQHIDPVPYGNGFEKMSANSNGATGLHYEARDLTDLFERTARTIAVSVELRSRAQEIRSTRRGTLPPVR
ncbi:hypothetical protein [Mycolicibacterium arseniciresistens]|uniref:Uncharacterized protein n=1 Tax=Mycolicibacterium arseniciresistens TaxID=3062257 RepID=A0ABT8UCT9_9MYCO|nr:hypothetical protein [Mycolicibacterium arseniciresistens]MDO3635604.1 hypothetical protein [Mycolicibacterium arseniciresistens]